MVVDARGARDAGLVALLSARATQIEIGGVPRVLSDDPATRNLLPAWVARSSNQLVATEAGEPASGYALRRAAPLPQRTPSR